MNDNAGLPLPSPRLAPPLDPHFRPAALANHAFRDAVRASASPVPLTLALEQADGSVFHHTTALFAEDQPGAAGNFTYTERLVKFLLWAWGGWRVHVAGPPALAARLQQRFTSTPTGRFDSDLIGVKVHDHPLTVLHRTPAALPPARSLTRPLGRHFGGCRIGFDLGGSDRKVAAVRDGEVVFSEETVWDPYPQPDPQYHLDGILDSLRKAAAHLPRVDAIGGSAAGVYVNNRVRVASLFRGVPPDVFEKRVRDLFAEVRRAMGGVPLEVANDGEVTALAGSMALGQNAVLGIAMGTSQAAGYVTPSGHITTWLNELAFAPVDYNPSAPLDEWSGDYGCGAQYFSQQAVARLMPAAGIESPAALPLPEKLKLVQSLMAAGDPRAARIYETIGVYLAHALAHYADFYDCRHVLILGRVTTGRGGDVILARARDVLGAEYPDVEARITFHVPDEHDRRHGQAAAAASLPAI